MSRDHRSDCRIYVRNLPPNMTDKDIEELFSKFGKISSIDLKSRSRQPSAFVEFEDSSHAVDAVHSRDGYQCDGHTLKVEFQRIKDRPTISSTNSGNSRNRTANGDKAPANSNCHSNVRHSGHNSWLTSVIRLLRIDTIYFATLELFYQLSRLTRWVLCHTRTCAALVLVAAIAGSVSCMDGPHQRYLSVVQKQLWWCVYWCGLGILSSVGFGTGLHTFLLYLGPHIASVTLAAYECDSLDFPSPPYPDEIICPVPSPGVVATVGAVNIWTIMAKVRLEAFMWGAGTALGELPPYFVARAHRLAGEGEEDLDPEMAEEIVTGEHSGGSTPEKPLAQRMRAYMIRLVTKVGFFGILACASIPNPLFDLAGITCGYSLVPFWTFFGATLIGKAVIKMHIQKLFVIIAFNESYVEVFVQKSRNIPFVGQYLHEPLREFLVKQKKSLHRGSATQAVKESSWLSKIFEWVVISMILYFLVSIVSSMSQNYQKRVQKHRSEEEEAINNSNHLKTQ